MRFLYLNTIDCRNPFFASQLLRVLNIQIHDLYTKRYIFKNHIICFATIFLFSACQLLAQSAPIYVDQQATGNNTGQNWADAYVDLQDAIVEAQYGDTVWVAQGIYKPTTSNDRTISFILNNGVAMIGGFEGNEEAIYQRDVATHQTILSGDIGVVDDSLDNSHHVVYAIGVDSTTLLDGFTIRAGLANVEDPSFTSTFQLGGGMLLDTNDDFPVSNPIIQNCIFIENSALRGGGLYIKSSEDHRASPQIKHCEFRNNYAGLFGGGLFKSGDAQLTSPTLVFDCTFSRNISQARGGGVFVMIGHWNLIFRKIVFEGNQSNGRGAAMAFEDSIYDSQVQIDSCFFKKNIGVEGSSISGIFNDVFFFDARKNNFQISNSSFEENLSNSTGSSCIDFVNFDAILSITLQNCIFKNDTDDRGYQIAVSIFDRSSESPSLSLDHCQFIERPSIAGTISAIVFSIGESQSVSNFEVNNTLFFGTRGAISLGGRSSDIKAKVINSTFVNNKYHLVWNQHGFTSNNSGDLIEAEIANSIFWSPTTQGAKIYGITSSNNNPTLYGFNLHHNLFSTDACDLPGGEEACQENNLFNVNPQFRDSLNGDFRLAGCSSAINAGMNTVVNTENDLAGHPRILEGRVDLGAYEQELFDLDITEAKVKEVSCYGEQDGHIELSTNGTPPLQYTWTSLGMTGTGNEQLSPGLYAVTVTDSLQCQENLFIQVDEPDSLQATFSLIPSIGEQMNGSITLEQVQGGRPPYQWAWSTGDNSPSVNNLSNGTYALTLTDRNGCTKQWNFDLALPNATISQKSDFKLGIFPNPIQPGKRFTIQYHLPSAQQYTFSLIDPIGRQLMQQSHHLKGTGQLIWPSISVAAGIYFLQVLSATGEVLALQKLLIVE